MSKRTFVVTVIVIVALAAVMVALHQHAGRAPDWVRALHGH